MNNRALFALIGSVIVGVLTAVQSRMNGGLSALLHNGFQAAVVSFGTGFVLLTIIVIAAAPVRRGLARIPAAVREHDIKPWQLLGGFIGGAFVAVQSSVVPLIGVAVFSVAMVAGQSVSSILVDRIGLGPAGRQAITWIRVLAAVIAIVAVFIAVSDRFNSTAFSFVAVAFAFIGGLAIAVQQAINGRVGKATRNPLSAAWLNFLLGFTGLFITLFAVSALSDVDPAALPPGPIWVYLGGAVGVIFIATAAWAVQIIGVLLFALASISGQLGGALLLDIVAPTAGSVVGWQLVFGLLLTGVAVLIAALGPKWVRSDKIST